MQTWIQNIDNFSSQKLGSVLYVYLKSNYIFSFLFLNSGENISLILT